MFLNESSKSRSLEFPTTLLSDSFNGGKYIFHSLLIPQLKSLIFLLLMNRLVSSNFTISIRMLPPQLKGDGFPQKPLCQKLLCPWCHVEVQK